MGATWPLQVVGVLAVAEPGHAAGLVAALHQRVRIGIIVVEIGAVKGIGREDQGDGRREDGHIELAAEQLNRGIGLIVLVNGVHLDADVRQPVHCMDEAAVVALGAEFQGVGKPARAGSAVADLTYAAGGIENFLCFLLMLRVFQKRVVIIHSVFHDILPSGQGSTVIVIVDLSLPPGGRSHWEAD